MRSRRCGKLGDFVLLLVVKARDLLERAMHLRRRQVGRTGQRSSVGRQKCRRRPAAHVITRIDVGAPVVVDAYGNEAAVDRFDDARIGVGRLVHHVAPMAPDGRDREQDRPVFRLRAPESFGTPFDPADFGRAIGAR